MISIKLLYIFVQLTIQLLRICRYKVWKILEFVNGRRLLNEDRLYDKTGEVQLVLDSSPKFPQLRNEVTREMQIYPVDFISLRGI